MEKDRAKIDTYRVKLDELFNLRDNSAYDWDTFNKTTLILLLNPELYTIWNYRREILLEIFKAINIDEISNILTQDLQLLLKLLKSYPKVYWIWNHRRWCLFELMSINKVDWNFEFNIVSKLLELDARNFHGWQYRRFVVENMKKGETIEKLIDINIKEFNYTTSKINSNLSNFSAWHNRSRLIPELYDLKVQNPPTLLGELDLVKTGMYMDSDDTSIWLYLYWLLTNPFFINNLSNQEYLTILNDQLSIVQELNELEKSDNFDNLDNSWCLKTIILLKSLISKNKEPQLTNDIEPSLTNDIKLHLNTLIKIDPLRKGRYQDMLDGKVSLT